MTTPYEGRILELRAKVDQKTISNPLHWLNLAGLFYLEKGENSLGNDESNKIFLATFPAPYCGSLHFKDQTVTFHPAKDVAFTSNHPAVESRPLITDLDSEPDLINIGSLTIKVIVRGPTTLVRIWDREAPAKKAFSGYKYYPAKEEYVVKAKYVPYDSPKKIKRLDMIGTETEGQLLGRALFTITDVDCSLEAEKDGKQLLFHFTDGTSKTATYGGGRKFRTPIPEGEEITLDFNITENWPCAYTPYATCPMVLQENRLPVSIEAGEKKYDDH